MTEDEQRELEELRAENAALKAAQPRLGGFERTLASARRESIWASAGVESSDLMTPSAADAAAMIMVDMGLV